MTLKPYAKYKDSGVEWLGKVPEHWEVKKLSYWIFNYGSGTTPSLEIYYSDDDGVPWVTTGELRENIIFSTTKNVKRIAIKDISALTIHPSGSLLIAMYGATVGRVAILGVQATLNQACFAIHPNQNLKIEFLNYWFQGFRNDLVALATGAGQPNVSADKILNLIIPAPDLLEQTTIAAYLDQETVRIDELIAQKTRFIELLKEKRSALITHAVTKGLNPDVKMKDSGVEWLGQVPEHWEVKAIKHIVETPITDGPHETPDFIDDGVPFVSAEAVSSGYIDFNKIRGYISEEDDERYSKKYRPRRNDIFMIKSGATTGITAIVDTDIKFNIWSPLAVIRCGKIFNPKFVLNFMRSKSYQEAIKLNWSFGTQQNIGMGVIGDIAITVPTNQEQTAIASYLDQETARIDELIQLTEQSINLIKERRSALITAAVTGKIDVSEQGTIGV